MLIILFIDYDNLLEPHKRAGVLDVTTRALHKVPIESRVLQGRCDVRIYGGWYEGSTLTQLAQDITVEIQSAFPTVLRCPTKSGDISLFSVRAELAYALTEEPTYHLLDTFRRKQLPYNVKCIDPLQLGCNRAHCLLAVLPELFRLGKCPEASCSISINDILFRNEQKLVDTMLACDVIHATTRRADLVVVVSNDDDLLPALRTALLRGTPVVRLHPKPNHKPAAFPAGGAPFVEKEL